MSNTRDDKFLDWYNNKDFTVLLMMKKADHQEYLCRHAYFARDEEVEKLEADNKELKNILEECFYYTVMRDPQVNTHKQACDAVEKITKEALAKIRGEENE